MPVIEIRTFQKGQETLVSQLIREVYDEFVAPGYTPKGNAFFYAYIDPKALLIRYEIQNSTWLSFVDDMLAGMIEIRDNNRVSLLFTRKEFQRIGVARKLLNEAIKRFQISDGTTKTIYVHASPYSIPAYQRLGFTATSSFQETNGITYLPMEINLR